ncbi:peptidylprolyl isomerase [Psychromonas hadalis]|uniref:peptidylprolyl isomerase n=1 Tax=Psychromonas hadalis TaxID=211669 RepID=UPI0003B62EBF|nr:peptidylprolyl isomerase [Psychromonas hadalis]
MKIKNDLVVSIHFGVAEVDGNALDSTENGAPLDFIQGAGYLVPGLEAELAGKEVGDKFDVKLEAKDAYGEFQDELVQQVPRDIFEGVDTIEVGMSFQAETEQGPRTVEVTEVTEKMISIDANHALAGMALQFIGEVVAIREATTEELEHGHIHQAGGCCDSDDQQESDSGCCGGDTSKHSEGESCCGGHGHEEAEVKEVKKEESPAGCCGSCH